jgi:hypothetical protein
MDMSIDEKRLIKLVRVMRDIDNWSMYINNEKLEEELWSVYHAYHSRTYMDIDE